MSWYDDLIVSTSIPNSQWSYAIVALNPLIHWDPSHIPFNLSFHLIYLESNLIAYGHNLSVELFSVELILEIVDCLNGLCENDFTYDENMYLLSDICITWHINIKCFILFYLVNHFIINVYFYSTISLKILLSTNKW